MSSWQGLLGHTSSSQFISTFCNVNQFPDHGIFDNELGGFTPCFTDIVVLGANQRRRCRIHAVSISCHDGSQRPVSSGMHSYSHRPEWNELT